MNGKAVLMILDGWGSGVDYAGNGITQSNAHFVSSLGKTFPEARLKTSGLDVGLPAGQMGNSEVGHMNIGAGRVVYQQLVLLNQAFSEHTVAQNPVWLNMLHYAASHNSRIHLLGLLGNGGVHASDEHLFGLIQLLNQHPNPVFIHGFLDGRDTDPHSGLGFLNDLQQHLQGTSVKIGTLIGRYYAMDRDKRWERIAKAWQLLVNGMGLAADDPVSAIKEQYKQGITDEFMNPLVVDQDSRIQPGDVVLFFNFRTDRGRELTTVLSQQDMPEQGMHTLPLHFVTMTQYDASFKNIDVLFPNIDLSNSCGEVVAAHGKTQVRIAETEKYPHVTFFFSGGREEPYPGETRHLCPSPKVATYDLQPEMSAYAVRDAVLNALDEQPDLLVVNFANPDMVGHTGVLSAVKKAIETVDQCAETIVKKATDLGYTLLITADHGNAEYMINDDGSPNTAHTTNDVPLWLVDNDWRPTLRNGRLADLAPTILKILNIPQPAEMTGHSLVE